MEMPAEGSKIVDGQDFDLESLEKVINHKKNVVAIILAMAYGEIGNIEGFTRFMRNRLYNADQIYEIFELLVQKKAKIKRALNGAD